MMTRSPESIVTQYNNFYEFGTDKSDPATYAHEMTTDPWSVTVSEKQTKPAPLPLKTSSRDWMLRSGCIASAALKPGPWWCLGWAFRWVNLVSI